MVDQVYSHGAYLRGGNENVADKFKALTSYLWKNSEFSESGAADSCELDAKEIWCPPESFSG